MSDSQTPIRDVSDTAFWVAHYRAEETRRSDPLFRDPLSMILLDDRAERIAASMGATSAHTRQNVIIRTVIIDRFLKDFAGEFDLVINLGAGLDTRPYRLDLPSKIRWVEIDFPHMIDYKNRLLAKETPVLSLERLALDVTDRAKRREIFSRLAAGAKSVLVLTEGVLPYLTESQVSELSEDLTAQPNIRFWIADYMSPHVYKYLKSGKRRRKMRNAPFQFTPPDWFGFFESRGWRPRQIQYIGEESYKLGRPMPTPWFMFLLKPFLSAGIKKQFLRASGYMLMERRAAGN